MKNTKTANRRKQEVPNYRIESFEQDFLHFNIKFSAKHNTVPRSYPLEDGGLMSSSDSAKNTAQIQRGRPFERGKSGNPKGRPKGARNRATVLAETLLDGEAEAITRKVIDRALEGDTTALRLCLERLLAPRRERTVAFNLPIKIDSSAAAVNASSLVVEECAAGILSPADASAIVALISSHIRLIEITEIETRLIALEKAQKP